MTTRPTTLTLAALAASCFMGFQSLWAQTPASSAATAIEPLLAAIEPAGIQRNIEKLVSFGTRHTLSDTVSETRGIGAARRWIKSEMERCAATSGGRMTVAFDGHTRPAGGRIPQAVEIVNVVATLKGTAVPERVIVVSGHYDSRAGDVIDATSDAPGAMMMPRAPPPCWRWPVPLRRTASPPPWCS